MRQSGAGLPARKSSIRVYCEQDRAADGDGGGGDQRLDQDELAAEAAADRHRHDVDPVDRQAERLGDPGAAVEGGLGAGVDGQVAERVDRRPGRPAVSR